MEGSADGTAIGCGSCIAFGETHQTKLYRDINSGKLTVSTGVDIIANTLKIGSNTGADWTRTVGLAAKSAFILAPHRASTQVDVMPSGINQTASLSQLLIGGGNSSYNAVSQLEFYTGSSGSSNSGGTKTLALDGFLDSISGTDAAALDLTYTTNTDGQNTYGLRINETDTLSSTHYLIDAQKNSASVWNVKNTGVVHTVPLASAPAACVIGDEYVDTSGSRCSCKATNTWEDITDGTTGAGGCI